MAEVILGVEPVENEMVNHPAHYTLGGIEVIDAIEAWQLDFSLGNAVKYIARAKHKGKELEDLRKAAWYINRAIENAEENETLPQDQICCCSVKANG